MRKWLMYALALAGTAALLAGCGGGSDDSGGGSSDQAAGGGGATTAQIAAPQRLKDQGSVAICADPTYPPIESQEGSEIVGSDVDVANEMTARMGIKPDWVVVGFDGLIAALRAHRCDLIMSGINDTPERAQQIDFVDYLSVGASLLAPKDNPEQIGGPEDLSGLTVSVLVGTTNKQQLDRLNKQFADAGRPPLKEVIFQKDTDAANALRTGKVDAWASDSPGVAYFATQNPDLFVMVGKPLAPAPWGIGVRKDDPELKQAVSTAIDQMYADGTMKKIMSKYQLESILMDR